MLKRSPNMHRTSRLALICCLITFAATCGQAQKLLGEFYEYEDQISMESRSGAAETVVMPEDQPNAPKSDQEKIDLIKEKMLKRRSGLVTRNNGQPATANTDDLAIRVLPPANFRAPLPRNSQSMSFTTTAPSSTTTTTALVTEVETDSRPKVRRTRPNGNRLRSTTTSTTEAPTIPTVEITTVTTAPVAEPALHEPELSASLTERKDEASLEDVVNISPLFRESVRRTDNMSEHTRDTAYFREQSTAELPIPEFPRARDLPTPVNETMDGVPIYFMNSEVTNETNVQLSTTVAPINEEIVPVTQESEAEFTTIFADRKDEKIPEDEEDFADITSDRRSDEFEGSRQLQRKLLDMMVSETKNILTAVMPDRAALAAFKYFPLFEPQLESRSFNNEPNYRYNAQQRPPPPPRHRPPPKDPHTNIRPNRVNRRPPPPHHPHERPESHHGKLHHSHSNEPQPPANFESYEPFSINFQPPKDPDFSNKPEPNYKPSQSVDYKYEQLSSPKPPTPQYSSEQSYEPKYPQEPTYVPQPPEEPTYISQPPKEPTYVPKTPKEPTHKPEYPQEPIYKPADLKPTQYEKPDSKVTEQHSKVPEYPSAHTEKSFEKSQASKYPKEPTYKSAYPFAPQQEKPSEKPTTPRYPQEPTYKAASASTSQYAKPNAPLQYPKEVAYETAPSSPQYEKPYVKAAAPKEPEYELSYAASPKDEKTYTRPPVPQYPKKAVYETSSSAPVYEKSPRNPYEKPTQDNQDNRPRYPQPPRNDKPYEKAAGPQYPKEPVYPSVPEYAKPAPQYPKEPTYEAAQTPALQNYKPAVQYPKQPMYDTSSPAPQYTKTSSTPAPYTTARQYPKKSYSTQAPQYPQNHYSSLKPRVSSPAPYVEQTTTYQKPTSPVYRVSTPNPYQPSGYSRPVKQYRVSSTPAPVTTARAPYQENYPDQPQQLKYPTAQQYPQESYLSPEPQQYYPQQYNQYTEELTRQNGAYTRKTPTRGNQQKQEQSDQYKKPESTDTSYGDTPFEQIDPVPETGYQQSQQHSVSANAPQQFKTKKPSSNQGNRATTSKPPSYPQQFPPRIPSMGFEGHQWAADDITADKFPDFKISSFFQDTPWPQQDSFISQNGGSQRQATQPKRKGGNSQRLQQPLHGELTSQTALKTEELLGLVAADIPTEDHVPESLLDFKNADYAAIPDESSPALPGARDSPETSRNPLKEAEDPAAESAVIATPTATRRKDTRTRPRIQNRRITKPKPQSE